MQVIFALSQNIFVAVGHYHCGMDRKPQDTESRHADKYIVRFPDGMRDKIAEAAKTAGRTMNAEIVARLQKSFEDPAVTEVPWDLRVERRALEARIDTVRAHQMTLRMYADALDSKYRNAVADGAPEEELRALKEKLSESAMDDRRIQSQLNELVAQSYDLEKHYDDASRPILKRIDVTVERQLQPDYRQLHATELKLGIPAELRTVQVTGPVDQGPGSAPPAKATSKKR